MNPLPSLRDGLCSPPGGGTWRAGLPQAVGSSPRGSPTPRGLFDEETDKGPKRERAQPVNPPGYYQSHNRLRVQRAIGSAQAGVQRHPTNAPAPTGPGTALPGHALS